MPDDRKQQLLRFALLYIHIALAVTISVSLIYLATPALKSFLLDEDRFLETLSALLGLCAFAYALFLSIRAKFYGDRRWIWPALVAATGLWSFLEEASYGRRISGMKAPRVMGVEIDGLHDFALVGKYYMDAVNKAHPLRVAVAAIVLGLIAAGLVVGNWSRIKRLVRSRLTTASHVLFALYVLLLGLSQLMDLGIYTPPRITVLLEENLEFSAALALFFSAVSYRSVLLPTSHKRAGSWRRIRQRMGLEQEPEAAKALSTASAAPDDDPCARGDRARDERACADDTCVVTRR